MGDGTVYTFSNFFLGTMSDKCKESDTAPCPEESADLNYVPDEGDERSLFGQAIASTKVHNFVSAPKSSTYARQSGVIYVYKNWFYAILICSPFKNFACSENSNQSFSN